MEATHLTVEKGHLYIGGVDTVELAERFGTPLYVTDENRLRENFQCYRQAFPGADIYYAAKANSNLAVLRILAQEGAGADVFSDGELYLALLAGIPRDRILFNGNSKTDSELEFAVETGVRVSVDSPDELYSLSKIASQHGKQVEITFRVNPNVSPETHPKIATGLQTSKFGIPHAQVPEVYQQALTEEGVKPVGLHCHIGSQILDLAPFHETVERMMEIAAKISELGVDLKFLDLGSGLGIPYHKDKPAPTPGDLAGVILPIFHEKTRELGINPKLILEPGRYIVGDTTILLTRVNTVKKAYRNFAGVDAGFNLLLRPAMYQAYHHVIVANKADQDPEEKYTIAGPICETGDLLAQDRKLPRLEKGDLIAILDTGAYGFSMSSQYNGRPRCPEVLVKNREAWLTRKRETLDDLAHCQIIPPHLLC